MAQRGFEEAVLPHLDAAFNYARWLARDDVEAEDVVQDAYVRALRFFPSLRSDDARAWLLAIVRNTFYSRVSKRPGQPAMAPWDREADDRPGDDPDPEALVLRQQTVERVREALEQLPVDFREVIVLREIEGLAYKEIAAIVQIPIGTVMSRLSRARERLLAILRPAAEPAGRLP
jgi:RNA polymerase sigma factor (sigma-70 family)